MGYDVYLSFNATVPNATVAEGLHNAFFDSGTWGPTLYVAWDTTTVYGTWEGRNCDEDEVVVLLQPLADQFGVTFSVTYTSDYDDGVQIFFVGSDAARLTAQHGLDQLGDLLGRLGGAEMALPIPVDQLRHYRARLHPQLTRLLNQLERVDSNG